MKRLARLLSCLLMLGIVAGCHKQPASAPADQPAQANEQRSHTPNDITASETVQTPAAAPASEPEEDVSETDDEPPPGPASTGVQPALKLGAVPEGPPTSGRFKEGTNYQKIVPAQPVSVAPGKVEIAEVFWYGCPHCYALDPAVDSWRSKEKPTQAEFVRIPAMWNEATRLHARVFYTAEVLGKLDSLHSLIFREIHVNNNPLNTVEKIAAFFTEHGVSDADFKKTFSSFAVESKLQRADFLNRRYRVDSVPLFIVNGKYRTDLGSAGSEANLFEIVDELAVHEAGG
ncbi:MAG TPA: DsbA family protein [Steroidobacteraceae bacterium]|nr:DsbA family protein [Steroidobacteraceae bacterium]